LTNGVARRTRTIQASRLIEWVYELLAKMPRWLMVPVAKFGHGIMQARQLRGVKRRAEAMAP